MQRLFPGAASCPVWSVRFAHLRSDTKSNTSQNGSSKRCASVKLRECSGRVQACLHSDTDSNKSQVWLRACVALGTVLERRAGAIPAAYMFMSCVAQACALLMGADMGSLTGLAGRAEPNRMS